jgi:hypothetical protein
LNRRGRKEREDKDKTKKAKRDTELTNLLYLMRKESQIKLNPKRIYRTFLKNEGLVLSALGIRLSLSRQTLFLSTPPGDLIPLTSVVIELANNFGFFFFFLEIHHIPLPDP